MTDKKSDFATAAHDLAVARAKLDAASKAQIDDEAAVKAHDEALIRLATIPATSRTEMLVKIDAIERLRRQPEGECLFEPLGGLIDSLVADAKRSCTL